MFLEALLFVSVLVIILQKRRTIWLEREGQIDSLTGSKNKHAYVEAQKQFDRQIKQKKAIEFAVVVLDVNNLKHINDTAGHQAGDQYIRDACRIICQTFKHSPVFRVGGDEFTVIAQGDDYVCIDELIERMNEHNMLASKDGGVVIACGMSKYEKDKCVSVVFERADCLMYENKIYLKDYLYRNCS